MTARKPKFEVYQGIVNEWRWRLVAANGKIVCQGEGHYLHANCLRAIRAVKRLAAEAEVVS